MKKKRKFALPKDMHMFVAKIDDIQAQVLNADAEAFEEHPEFNTFIRLYVPGEFPKQYFTQNNITDFSKIKYVGVYKNNNVISRTPMTEEEYEHYKAKYGNGEHTETDHIGGIS